jgi:hypothetical protein
MNRQYIANQIVSRGDRTSYKYRDQAKQNSALISLLCGMVIGLTVLGCFLCKSCAPDPVCAYSLCEGCGEMITDADHGRCQAQEVASCE